MKKKGVLEEKLNKMTDEKILSELKSNFKEMDFSRDYFMMKDMK